MSKFLKMKELIAEMNLPDYRYKQLLDAVFRQHTIRFEDMKPLPKELRGKLIEQFGETVIGIKAIHHEKSTQTDKVLFELPDGNRVETVGLFYKEVGIHFVYPRRAVVHLVVNSVLRARWVYIEI